jgi:hypothetical protein
MGALGKMGLFLQNVADPTTLQKYGEALNAQEQQRFRMEQMRMEQQEREDQRARQSALMALAPELGTMDPGQALARMAAIDPNYADELINYRAEAPERAARSALSSLQLQNARNEASRGERLRGLFSGGGLEDIPAMTEAEVMGPYTPANPRPAVPMNPAQNQSALARLDPVEIARQAAAIDPENFLDNYLSTAKGPEVKEVGGRLVRVNPDGTASAVAIDGMENAVGEETLKNEQLIRKEFTTANKEFSDIQDGFSRFSEGATSDSAAGDIALVYGFMKMNDPTSTVREGEYATAENAAGVPERVKQMWNKLQDGQRLTPSMRQDFVKTGRKLYGGQHKVYQNSLKTYRGIASQYDGIDALRAVPDISVPGLYQEDFGPPTGLKDLPAAAGWKVERVK